MIKLFASDLDGTPAQRPARGGPDHPESAIKTAIDLGAHVVPATGRSVLPIGDHGFTGLKIDAVCANGSIVRGQNGEVLKTFAMDPAFVEELVRANSRRSALIAARPTACSPAAATRCIRRALSATAS